MSDPVEPSDEAICSNLSDAVASSLESIAGNDRPAIDGEAKKAAACLIEKFYFMLRDGCGRLECNNPNCASSGQVIPMTSNEAAVKALQLLQERAPLCESSSSTLPFSNCNRDTEKDMERESDSETPKKGDTSNEADCSDAEMDASPATLMADSNQSAQSVTSTAPATSGVNSKGSTAATMGNSSCSSLTEERLKSTIEECISSNSYAPLRILLRLVFSNDAALKVSFLLPKDEEKDEEFLKQTEVCKDLLKKDSSSATKKHPDPEEDKIHNYARPMEDVDDFNYSLNIDSKGAARLQGASSEAEKDSVPSCGSNLTCLFARTSCPGIDMNVFKKERTLDIDAVRNAYEIIFQCPEKEYSSTLMDAMRQLLKDSLSIQLRVFPTIFTSDPAITHVVLILLENPLITSTEYTDERVLGELCRVVSQLGVAQQASIVRHISILWEKDRTHRFLEALHQLITIKLMSTQFSKDFTINDEDTITSATRVMKIIYYASICSGELDPPLLADLPPPSPTFPLSKEGGSKPPPWDKLGEALRIHPLDSRQPLIPYNEFYDDFLSDQLEVDRDFAYFKAGNDRFSFLSHPFILTPATKALGLYYDNRIRMYSERRMSIYQTLMEGTPMSPYLHLRIRRDHIIEDALVELEVSALENPGDLKKQLVVEFEGEQGIDEGGVSKEFFQLIVEQIFNPDYAMFCLNQESQTFWFNPTSFESDAQFTLVGAVLGLAIYNNVILDLHFPAVLYKKLCSKPGSFQDLKDWNITLHRSLTSLLVYEGDDVEDVFVQTFRVGYNDIFGSELHHDLKPKGETILVNQSNKIEFVELYADFLLNKSVESQFSAFKRGFAMVTEDSPLQMLFRPHELELLLCGSQHYDFSELKKSTEYDGGYTDSSPVISWFWSLVEAMPEVERKQLLQFTTGSARVPVGGLARLKLIIAKHGPDTNRLPTAHTCFNVLLLPEYSSKEKLKDRLLKAIKYAQGFGML